MNTETVSLEDAERLEELRSLLDQDAATARRALETFATQGLTYAMMLIANSLNKEEGPAARDQALTWYKRAGDAGSREGAYMAGVILSEGDEAAEGVSYLKKASAMSYLPAIYRLAVAYRDGVGVSKDLQASSRIFRAAAIKGHLFSIRDLLTLYITGKMGVLYIPLGLLLMPFMLAALLAEIGSMPFQRDGLSNRLRA